MSEEKRNWLGPYVPQDSFIREFAQQAKLIWNLVADKRVHPLLKLIPFGVVAYAFWPADVSAFIPGGLIPGISAMDDMLVAWFGLRTFIELAPPGVVTEHLQRLAEEAGFKPKTGDWQVVNNPPAPASSPKSEVVDDGQ